MILQRYAIAMLVLFGLTWVPRGAWARCEIKPMALANVTFKSPIQLDWDAPPGTVIATSDLVVLSGSNKVICSPGPVSSGFESSFPANDQGDILGTKLSGGIVMRIKNAVTGVYLKAYPGESVDLVQDATLTLGTNFLVELIQNGVADTSTLDAGLLGWWRFDTGDGDFAAISFALSKPVNFTYPACTVNAPSNISLTLPPVSVAAFKGQGSTAKETPFKIGIYCPFAGPGSRTVTLRFESVANSDRTTGVIAPATEVGSAIGVGVQLLNSNHGPIEFNKRQNIGKTSQTNFDYTYFARYYQTGPAVTAGTVKATATLTLSYL